MMPRSPSSAIRFTVACGKRASRSHSPAMGFTSCSAKSRARAWIICCSSVSSSFMAPCSPGPPLSALLLELLELLFQERDHLEEVPHQPEVGDLEDGRLRVLVHRADDLGGPHAGQMLD